MIERVVEIEGSQRYLSRFRGFLVVSQGSKELGRIPLDDISVVIAHAYGVTYSNELLVALTERCIPLVVCNRKHLPVGWFLPYSGNHLFAERLETQIAASLPLKKRIWQALVRGKIRMQASLLDTLGRRASSVSELGRRVRSGDPENVEAQAAKRYWPLIMGHDFRRRRDADGENALLNYGYTVLRSAVARSVIKAGLHPALGLHHRSAKNAFALVDDLIEPLRPAVDRLVLGLVSRGLTEINKESKQILASVLVQDLVTARGRTLVATCADRLAFSVVASFAEGKERLDLPREFPSLLTVKPNSAEESEVA